MTSIHTFDILLTYLHKWWCYGYFNNSFSWPFSIYSVCVVFCLFIYFFLSSILIATIFLLTHKPNSIEKYIKFKIKSNKHIILFRFDIDQNWNNHTLNSWMNVMGYLIPDNSFVWYIYTWRGHQQSQNQILTPHHPQRNLSIWRCFNICPYKKCTLKSELLIQVMVINKKKKKPLHNIVEQEMNRKNTKNCFSI